MLSVVFDSRGALGAGVFFVFVFGESVDNPFSLPCSSSLSNHFLYPLLLFFFSFWPVSPLSSNLFCFRIHVRPTSPELFRLPLRSALPPLGVVLRDGLAHSVGFRRTLALFVGRVESARGRGILRRPLLALRSS